MQRSSDSGPRVDIPGDWAVALARILARDLRRVAVVGPADAGKSSFVSALLAAWARAGRQPLLLDTDPGQKMVGPPGAVTLGDAADGLPRLERLAFVGTPSAAAASAILRGAGQLAAGCPARPLAINTSGFVVGPGLSALRAVVERLQPQLLVAIGPGPGLEQLLATLTIPARRLTRSAQARRKSPARRAALRRTAFAAHLADAVARPVELDPAATPDICLRDPAAHPVVGLVGPDGQDVALGVIAASAPGGARVELPATAGAVAGLRLGSMWARRRGATWELLETLVPAGAAARRASV